MNNLVTPANPETAVLSQWTSAGATSITVNSTTNFDSSGFLSITIQNSWEIVEYAGISGNTFTGVTRGSQGTTAREFPLGSIVQQLEWMPIIAEADTVATTTDVATRNYTIQYQDDGVDVSTKGGIQYINFTGSGVAVTNPSAGLLGVDVSGGGSGLTQPQVMARTLGC